VKVRGFVQVHLKEEPIEESAFLAEYKRIDGKWLLNSLVELESEEAPAHYEQIKELAWLVGTWEDDSLESHAKSTWDWTLNKNFIVHTFETSSDDLEEFEGRQLIGWDPEKQVLRSWVFHADGGFGSGVIERQGDDWIFTTESTLPEGGQASSVNTFHKIDENTYTWESTGRAVDDEILPNIDPVTIKRVQ